MNFGKLINQYREKNSISQAIFGKMVGVNKQTVSRWEKGTLLPSSSMCYRISNIIQIPLEYIFNKELNDDNFLPVFKDNIQYDIGLNAVFWAIKNYDTLSPFIDMLYGASLLFNNDYPFGYMILEGDAIDNPNTTEQLPIVAIQAYDDKIGIVLSCDEPQDPVYILRENIKTVKPRYNFRNIVYSFDIFSCSNDREESKIQIVIDMEEHE